MRNVFFATASAAMALLVPNAQAQSALQSFHFETPDTADPNDTDQAPVPEPLQTPINVASTTVQSWGASARKIATTTFGWNGIAGGKGVTIGIVDSGIDLDHSEFAGRVLTGTCFGGSSSICSVSGASKGGDPAVRPGEMTHGTHVAGIAAGATVGIANRASILSVKVCDSYSSSCPGSINTGIVWASEHGAKVINLSIAGPGIYSADIAVAAKAVANGAVMVVAAGNRGNSTPAGGYMAGAALKAGVRGAMIVVGATGLNNQLAPFSQTPGSTCETYGGKKYCMKDYFVVAPGKGIKSSVGGGGYGSMSGTSMASPYVAGVAAVIKGLWPTLTPYQVADIIFRTADDLGAAGTDTVYGRGAVNIDAAVQPVSGASLTAVTSGTNLQNAGGIESAADTVSMGVFSAGLHESAVLKNTVVLDSYGRDFRADLSDLAQTNGMSLIGLLRDPFQTTTPFALAGAGYFGAVSVSGLVAQRAAPQAIGANAALEQNSLTTTTQNLAISFSPMRQLSFDFGHNLNLSGYFNAYDLRTAPADNGLFLSGATLNSPYVALADGGNFTGVSFAPMSNLRVRFGMASVDERDGNVLHEMSTDAYRDPSTGLARDARDGVRSTIAGVNWDFASWGGIGVTATHAVEQGGTLGGFTAGAFAFAEQSATRAVGVSARMSIGDGWVTTLAYNEGVTEVDLAPAGLVTSLDTIKSRAYGIALTKHFVFGNDALGFAVTRPLHIYQGGATLRAATGLDENRNLVFESETLSLAAQRPQTDLELAYMTRLLGGAAVLQVSGAYQMDVSGLPGKNAIAAMSRFSVRF